MQGRRATGASIGLGATPAHRINGWHGLGTPEGVGNGKIVGPGPGASSMPAGKGVVWGRARGRARGRAEGRADVAAAPRPQPF